MHNGDSEARTFLRQMKENICIAKHAIDYFP